LATPESRMDPGSSGESILQPLTQSSLFHTDIQFSAHASSDTNRTRCLQVEYSSTPAGRLATIAFNYRPEIRRDAFTAE